MSQTPQIRHMKRQLSRMASRLVELDITSATPAPLTSRSGSGGSIGSSSMGRATSFLAQQAAAFPSPRLTASSAPSEAGDSVLPQPSWAAGGQQAVTLCCTVVFHGVPCCVSCSDCSCPSV